MRRTHLAAPASPPQPAYSAFDDTQTIELNDSLSVTDHQESAAGHTDEFGSLDYRNSSTEQRLAEALVGFPSTQEIRSKFVNDDDGWRATVVDHERRRRGEPPFEPEDDADDLYDQGREPLDDPGAEWEHTPSRSRTHGRSPHVSTNALAMTDADWDAQDQSQISTRAQRYNVSGEGAVDPSSRSVMPRVNRFKTHTVLNESALQPLLDVKQSCGQGGDPTFSSKVSSLPESSEDGQEPGIEPASALFSPSQYPFQGLDFDPTTLKDKTIADLDAVAFSVDPSVGPTDTALDANGTPMSLAARLTNLTKMRPEDRRQLFMLQTDSEREDTATWFLEKFKSDMQRLMAARVERRKIALKYELAVRKRVRQVECQQREVKRGLEDLKKGGAELIAGRTVTT